jgi:hypothetical protein
MSNDKKNQFKKNLKKLKSNQINFQNLWPKSWDWIIQLKVRKPEKNHEKKIKSSKINKQKK